jgi:kynurenine formamidase
VKDEEIPREHVLRYRRVVHLSHVLAPAMPQWPGDPRLTFEPVASLATQGYALRRLAIGEHSGTHVNAPISFHAGGASIDAYPAAALVAPAVLIDVSAAAARDADHRLSVDEVTAWEAAHGGVPAGAVVLLRSGWAARWNEPARFLNAGNDGRLHFPGFSLAAADLLLDQRGAAGLGVDTHGVDGGDADGFAVNARVLERPRLLLENLANLEQLPAVGATIVVGALRLAGGTGSPAAVLAFV